MTDAKLISGPGVQSVLRGQLARCLVSHRRVDRRVDLHAIDAAPRRRDMLGDLRRRPYSDVLDDDIVGLVVHEA
jgi:hypothetical protein